MSFVSLRAAVAASLMLASVAAHAEVRKFEYTGTISYSADATVQVGSQFKGYFTYDDALPDGDPMPGYGLYQPTTSISGAVGTHVVDADAFTIRTYDDFGGVHDSLVLDGAPIMVDNQVYPEGVIEIALQSAVYDTDALPSDGLPSSFDLSKWPNRVGTVIRTGVDGGTLYQFSIDSIVEVPRCLKQNGKDAKKICWSR